MDITRGLNKVNYLIFILFTGIFLITSCEKEELKVEKSKNNIDEISITENKKSNNDDCLDKIPNKGSLVSDGCNFTSGQGTDFENRDLMIDMLNNCRTEPLLQNCVWAGNRIRTKNIYVNLINCDQYWYTLNDELDSWKQMAINERPFSDSSFIITKYEIKNEFFTPPYGPYQIKIEVSYRKKICSQKEGVIISK
ncbi:hypothetical protein [Aquimarina megaterium]|uniref:hypothetical protein n=1 Tax=Aquimarina megaterium TaxID=1443666 RepID=UPI000943B5B8|nr:hypothetical protein [Aquimarina megaterium]